jgi:5'-3' exonuclease
MLMEMGLPFLAHRDTEADDLAGLLCRILPDMPIVLATTDSDWAQALCPTVIWHNTRTNLVTTVDMLKTAEFKDGPFASPEQYLAAKCLAGDTSDEIEGISGVGLKTAVSFMQKFDGNIESVWAAADSGVPMSGLRLQASCTPEARAVYARNRKLMDWAMAELPLEVSITKLSPDPMAVAELTTEFGLNSVAKVMPEQLANIWKRQADWTKAVSFIHGALNARVGDYADSVPEGGI